MSGTPEQTPDSFASLPVLELVPVVFVPRTNPLCVQAKAHSPYIEFPAHCQSFLQVPDAQSV